MPRVTQPPRAQPARAQSPRAQAARWLGAFWRDRRGVSAVEFAFLAPVLLLFYCGMAELTQAMMAQRRLTHLTSSIGDIVAQQTRLTDARRTDVFKVGGILMAPFPSAKLRMCLYSVISDANGKDVVDWVEPNNAPTNCPADAAVVTNIPTSVLPASASVIVSKASYDYTSPMKLISPNPITFRSTFYLKPRLSDSVARTAS
jgi:Flp pilus assembly protein TadG